MSGQRILPERSDSEWMSHAECANYPPDWWFPARGQPSPQARSVCLSCPVRTECLDYAISHNERHGIWGGLSEKQRRDLRRQWVRRCADCGALINTRGTRMQRCDECRPKREHQMRAEIQRRHRLRTIG